MMLIEKGLPIKREAFLLIKFSKSLDVFTSLLLVCIFDDSQSTYLLKKKITLEKGDVVLGHEYSICPKVPLNRF